MVARQIRPAMQRDVHSLTHFFRPDNFLQFFLSIFCLPLPIWGQSGACWDNSAAVKLSQTFAPVSSARWDPLCGYSRRRETGSLVMKPCPPRQQISPNTRDISVLYRKEGIFGFPSSQIFPEIYFAVFPRRSWIETCELSSRSSQFYLQSGNLTDSLARYFIALRPLIWFISLLHWIHKYIT